MENRMSIKRKGLTLTVFEDDVEDPREYYKDTNVTNMVCFHRRYQLGDEHNFKTPSDFNEWYKENKDKVACIMPLYLLDHSGLAISTHDFMDPWDSGQVGYIYILKDTLKKHNMADDIGSYDVCRTMIETEVEEYDRWLRGIPQYYAFNITDQNDEPIECMGVFEFTSFEDMISEMKDRSEHKFDFLFNALLKEQESYL